MMHNYREKKEVFNEFKSKPIALYGLGDNARLLVQNLKDYNIVCLVATDHIGEEKYGLKILAIDDAIDLADVIIIAASFSATSIIFSRIMNIVPSGMPILNMLGENLVVSDVFDNDPYWNEDYSELIREIDNHEAISFDIFDTLIMRDVLEPKDVFAVLALKINNVNFTEARIDSDKRCRLIKNEPTLDDIYNCIEAEGLNDLKETLKYEVFVELRHVRPRRRMVEALKYALSNGKKVFLTSDMYLKTEEINKLLKKCEVFGDYKLLISCEYGCSKLSGALYDILKNEAGTTSIVHIGDDEHVDKNKAKDKGIDSYLIHSSYRMLAMSPAAYIYDAIESFSDKCYLGYYISSVLNDPFAMNEGRGKVNIISEKDVALLLFPITKMFFDYIIRYSTDYDCLIFPSRDGFFLYNMYCEYRERKRELNLPDARYVYSSRISLSRAALRDRDSLILLIHKLFLYPSKNFKRFIKDLFGYLLPNEFDYTCSELIDKWGKNTLIEKLNIHLPKIIDSLSLSSGSYMKYIDSLGISKYRRIALIDIVSFGTQPYCLSKILDKRVDMISIGTTCIPNVFLTVDRVHSIYGNVNDEEDGIIINNSDLSVLHLFLEMLYSSKDGQFMELNEKGIPVFLKGSEYNSDLLEGVQTELRSLFNDYGANADVPCDFSKKFSHGMLRILMSRFSIVSEELKKKFVFSDPLDGAFETVNLVDSL